MQRPMGGYASAAPPPPPRRHDVLVSELHPAGRVLRRAAVDATAHGVICFGWRRLCSHEYNPGKNAGAPKGGPMAGSREQDGDSYPDDQAQRLFDAILGGALSSALR